MDRFRADRYERLDSSEDIALQPPDFSIELAEYDSRQDKKGPRYDDGGESDPYGGSSEQHQTRSYTRSILSNISNPFRDPHVELDDERLQTLNLQKNRRNILGWRMGAVVSACTAGVVFLINLLFLIVAMATVGQRDGIGTLYQGDCNTVKRMDTTIHLILNLLGVAVLGASNYTTQCLSSPTRHEIDKAHAKRKALDIGLPSAYNLRFMSRTKILVWSFLMLSTLPLHLLWNSSIFSTVQTNEYTVVVGTSEFLNNGTTVCTGNPDALTDVTSDVTCPVVEFIRNGYSAGNYTELNPSDFINTYATTFLVGHRNVIAIMDTTSPDANYFLWPPSTFVDEFKNTTESYYDYWPQGTTSVPASMKNSTAINGTTLLSGFNPIVTDQFESATESDFVSFSAYPTWQWLCNYYTVNGSCTTQSAQAFGESWQITPAMYPIETCYTELVPPLCKLEYASLLVGIVLICNATKTICMALTAWKLWRLDNPLLVTIGDAASSFLEHPDETTRGYCLMDRSSVKAWKKRKIGVKMYKPPKVVRFFRTASILRWLSTLLFCCTFIGAAGGLLQLAVTGMEGSVGFTEKEVLDAGFGTLNPNALLPIVSGLSNNLMILENVLVANSPQLVLSISYFMYNAIYTAQLGAYEWSQYAQRKKPLRVSFPRGNQVSTYFLQLPFWYSVPLSAALALLHYLISQSIFLANIEYYDAEGNFDVNNYQPALGYSPVAILASILVGSCVVLALVINSFRKLHPAMPLMGNNSAVISAACHPDPKESDRGFLPFKYIRWGATSRAQLGGQPGHCSFSTGDVDLPVAGEFYE